MGSGDFEDNVQVRLGDGAKVKEGLGQGVILYWKTMQVMQSLEGQQGKDFPYKLDSCELWCF